MSFATFLRYIVTTKDVCVGRKPRTNILTIRGPKANSGGVSQQRLDVDGRSLVADKTKRDLAEWNLWNVGN